jgi:putative peptidoglycan binding protein
MRIVPTALAAAIALGLLGIALDTGAGSGDEADLVAHEVDGLRGCGAMHRGDGRIECVRHLQRVLRLRGASIEPTGNYLAETTKNLTEFQTGRRLRPDGVLDQRTLDALTDLPHDPDGWDLRRDCVSLRRPTGHADGSQGTCVTTLRARLSAHGVPAGHGDTFDTDAAAAVATFQQRNGLPPIGVADPQTRQALYRSRPDPGSTAANCTRRGCLIVIGRADTRDLANAFMRGLLAEAVSAAVCYQVLALPAVGLLCQATGGYLVDMVAQALNTASARRACLRVTVGYPPGQSAWTPLTVSPYRGTGCRD